MALSLHDAAADAVHTVLYNGNLKLLQDLNTFIRLRTAELMGLDPSAAVNNIEIRTVVVGTAINVEVRQGHQGAWTRVVHDVVVGGEEI